MFTSLQGNNGVKNMLIYEKPTCFSPNPTKVTASILFRSSIPRKIFVGGCVLNGRLMAFARICLSPEPSSNLLGKAVKKPVIVINF